MLTEVSLFKNLKQKVSFFVQSLSLNKCVNRTGRKLALTLTDILTLSLFRHTAQITTKKKLWELFELPCSYKTLVVNINRFFELALTILMLILKYNRKNCHLVKHIDSTDIPVCSLRKSDSHRVMKEFATLGKTGKGWFYGLKLHLIADLEERILALRFTSGTTDDREVVVDLAGDLSGIFIADAGYVSEKLERSFYQEGIRGIFAKARSNMKQLATKLDTFLYGTRMRIELNFRNLKCFFGLITSLPRSVAGYLANYTYAILSYVLG
ncbi:MAG TPA: IS982 family transposase [Candidatus Hodarchaeales archaeon]|nr:IS982 family transposase [Candidatus Hodarchaeales archaeon]